MKKDSRGVLRQPMDQISARDLEFDNTFSGRDRGIGVSMGKKVILFPTPPQLDDEAPIEFASFRIGSTRLVLDFRGPEPKYRADPAESLPITAQSKRSRKKGDSRKSH